MIKSLLIDDWRDIPAEETARTFDEGVEKLKQGCDTLYLDHDFGLSSKSDREKNGALIAKMIRDNELPKPKRVVIVSMNPVGGENIRNMLLDGGYKEMSRNYFALIR